MTLISVSLTFPDFSFLLWNSLTFPGFPGEWPPCTTEYNALVTCCKCARAVCRKYPSLLIWKWNNANHCGNSKHVVAVIFSCTASRRGTCDVSLSSCQRTIWLADLMMKHWTIRSLSSPTDQHTHTHIGWLHQRNRVRTDIQMQDFQDFSGLAKTKFQGFTGLKNPFFQDFPGNVPLKTLVAQGQKVHIQNRLSVYLH